ncbi:hypothetical protein BIY29_06420 [Brenneria alni]|uniref:DUF423 domain-containing protein n=1 Tax=Brenneria alni TaxID=71656 RepID=A0A421DQP7_9GAMM|nr:DUF423 domain-containing protein [Brenneria alni]RLM25912.1 hypothetical protein BIY29_06420 [Brenneria alni]
MSSRFMLVFSAISGFVFVALGALGSHMLSKTLGPTELSWLRTGLEYQAFHTLAVLALSVSMHQRINRWFYWSCVLLALGTVLFSGSLYCLALSHLKLWVYITPIGGFCFLVGWLLMLVGALRLKRKVERHE